MHPIFIVAVPLVLIFVGMILNSVGLAFDQPPTSSEQDPTKKLAIERETYRQFFDRQRSQAMKRQHRVGQYSWLLLLATIGSFVWLYLDTVNKTVASNRIAGLQTLSAQEEQTPSAKEEKVSVLSVTLIDGSNVKYIIKLPAADHKTDPKAKEAISTEKVSSWELQKLKDDKLVFLTIGDSALPLGVALKKVSN